MSHQKGTADMNENIKQSVIMTPKMCDEIEKYSLNHHISKSQAIRALLQKLLHRILWSGSRTLSGNISVMSWRLLYLIFGKSRILKNTLN